MKKWLITISVVLILIGLGVTVELWLRPLLTFIIPNANLIQTIADLTQIILWILAGMTTLIQLWRPNRSAISPVSQTPGQRDRRTMLKLVKDICVAIDYNLHSVFL